MNNIVLIAIGLVFTCALAYAVYYFVMKSKCDTSLNNFNWEGKCTACGKEGQDCCKTNACKNSGGICLNNKCIAPPLCGKNNQDCCKTNPACTDPLEICYNNTCGPCVLGMGQCPPGANCKTTADCASGNICPCAGPKINVCVPASELPYASGYAWQGPWVTPTTTTADCPEECSSLAGRYNHWTWSNKNCTYGPIGPGGCSILDSESSSDSAAAQHICKDSSCVPTVENGLGAICMEDKHCPSGIVCEHAVCKNNPDCDNSTGPCEEGKCHFGTCSNGGCNNDDDCNVLCCVPSACASPDHPPCSSGQQCIGGYMCCGGDACVSDPNVGCVDHVCKFVDPYSYSCDMNHPFMPNATQIAQLKKVCSDKAAGSACSVNFDEEGTLKGNCIGSPLSCAPLDTCVSSTTGKLSDPKGTCENTCSLSKPNPPPVGCPPPSNNLR